MASVIKSRPPRAVVHLNIADFAAEVERRADQSLKKRPLLVAPLGGRQAAVYDMSDEAYKAGVRKLMPLGYARDLCRDAVVVPPNPALYARAMEALLKEVLAFSPLIEPGEIDGHFFVDVTGTGRLFGTPQDAARCMHHRILDRFALSPAWSAAPNKLVSKVATRLVKPVGEYVVRKGEEAGFLSPLPVSILPGIKTEDLIRLNEFNLFKAGQVAALNFEDLEAVFGRRAGFIHDAVRGIDPSPVAALGEKSWKISASCRPGFGTSDIEPIYKEMHGLASKIGAELRNCGKAAQSLAISLEYADGRRCFRQMKVSPPSSDDITLFETCHALLEKAWIRRVRLARVCVTCIKPVPLQVQMELFSEKIAVREKRNALFQTVDRIRNRFGNSAVLIGRALGTS